ncbi:hypothetical protein ABZZ47_26005 [Streptomyces sp. NPDC006465]|uniref:hypothetical protein n=1 Tax=Streptomyces sp. NPDC006465 TaxID=3157174 RepID=UPI0033BAA0B2
MSPFPSCYDLLDVIPRVCPGCRAHAPSWRWVRVDGLRILTHDGDLICPKDRTFGALVGPVPLAPVEAVAVTA